MGDVTKVLEQLVELLTAKADGASSTGISVPQPEVVQKVELMPHDIKLEGVSNYLSWSRGGLLILGTKGLIGYVKGEVREPVDKLGEEWKKWSIVDSLVRAWMLNSLTPTIAASVESLSSAIDMWMTLETMYSGKGNVMVIA